MASKKNKKTPKTKKVITDIPDDVLPQNMVAFGEHDAECDKIIYISQKVYKEIHKFAQDKTKNESGGVLIGNVLEEFGKTHIIIRAFVEAKHSEGTPTTLTFTHESWNYINSEKDKKYPDYKILGWIHTHPNFGIFLSEYDKFIQENFFNDENNVAYVVDPIQNEEGFYFWVNGKTERCKEFYVYDLVGKDITVAEETEKPAEEAAETAAAPAAAKEKLEFKDFVEGIIILVLMLIGLNLGLKVNTLTQQQQLLTAAASEVTTLTGDVQKLQQQVEALEERIAELEAAAETEEAAEGETENAAE